MLEPTFASRSAQIAVAYVAFAREDPARFEVMFSSGIDKTAHPELLEQTRRIQGQLEDAFSSHIPEAGLVERAAELWAIAHGVAALSVGGSLLHVVDPSRIDALAASAAQSWATGVTGADGGGAR